MSNDVGDCIFDAASSAAKVGGLTSAAAGAGCAGLQFLGFLSDVVTFGGGTVAATAACTAMAVGATADAAVTTATVSAAKSAQGQRRCEGIGV